MSTADEEETLAPAGEPESLTEPLAEFPPADAGAAAVVSVPAHVTAPVAPAEKDLETRLNARVIGQPNAVRVMSKALLRSQHGFSEFNRPQGSFLFLGPTGVGKTELVKAIIEYSYCEADATEQEIEEAFENHSARYDMAQFQDEASMARMFGDKENPNGQLGDDVDRLTGNGGGILLFDEFEKAHPSFKTVFLAGTDDARLQVASGEVKNLSWQRIIFTSNLGGRDIARMEGVSYTTMHRHSVKAAEKYTSPEFLGRLDGVLVFNRLTFDIQAMICRQMIAKQVRLQAASQKERFGGADVRVAYPNDAVVSFLVKRGYDRYLGARPMRGTVKRFMEDALVGWLMAGGRERLQRNPAALAGRHLVFSLAEDKTSLLARDEPLPTTPENDAR